MRRLFHSNVRLRKPRNLLATAGRWFTLSWWRTRTRRQRVMAGVLAVVALTGVLIPLFLSQKPAEAATWWSTSWTYRRKIIFNNTPSGTNLTNFPVRISLNSSNVDYSNTQNSGQDIRFVDSDDSTVLSHEIEKWNEAGTSEVWVKVPQIDAGSNTDFIWMYYGNAGAADGQAATSVWDSNFREVYHMNDASGATLNDSTSNNKDGSQATSTNRPTPSTGQIDGDLNYDGSNDAISALSPNLPTGDFTFEAWVKLSNSNNGQIINALDGSNTNALDWAIDTNALYLNLNSDAKVVTSTILPPVGSWVHVVAKRSGGTITQFINDVADPAVGTGYSTAIGIGASCALNVGFDADSSSSNCTGSPSNWLAAGMDELRISATARSNDWINATYRTETNEFNTFGVQETQSDTTPAWCSDASGVTCDTTWTDRRRVYFINTQATANLTNFPVLVVLNSSNIDYSKTQNSGQDIRFVDPSDPTTVLPHEIEKWNESGNSYVWVKVPQINYGSGQDYIWMYYNNAGASDGQAATSTWDSNYKAVWHMNQDPGTAGTDGILDSTSNGNNGTDSGTMTSADTVTGEIGSAINFDGSDDNITLNTSGNVYTTSASAITVSGWGKLSSFPGFFDGAAILGGGGSAAIVNKFEIDGIYGLLYNEGSPRNSNYSSAVGITNYVSTGSYHYYAMTLDTATDVGKIYLDGAPMITFSYTAANIPGKSYIATDASASGNDQWNGDLDEIRVSHAVRSDSWVQAEYLTGNNTMNTFGAEEGYLPAPTLSSPSSGATGVSLTPTFQLRGSDPDSPSYLRYKIDVCTVSDCSVVLRTIDETASQTGWSGQDAQTSTAYVASSTLASSTMANHTYQAPALSNNTTYYWRGYSIDPSGTSQWTSPSSIQSFTTLGQNPPAQPTLITPAASATNVSTLPSFTLRATDAEADYLRYKIQVCSVSDCSVVVRTIDQTSSQTGWSGQDTQTSTAYVGSATLSSSTIATHTYQASALSNSTTYYWRAYAIDPGGTNTFGSASSIQSFTTGAAQATPAAPTLVGPIGGAATTTSPTFQLRSTDTNSDYLRYKIEVCSVSNCSVVVRTIDQTSSQTGWSGQDTQSGTAYSSSTTISGSTIATHIYQPSLLTFNTQYWWRAYAIDPGGTNTFSSVSSIETFTTSVASGGTSTQINGGTTIRGGTTLH